MRTRRATSFMLAAAVLCAAVRSSAQDASAGASPAVTRAPAAPAGATAYKSPAALNLHDQFVAHEQNVLFHLTGRKTTSFNDLRKRQSELAQSLDQASDLPADEHDALTADLQKIGRLLFITEPLARGEQKLDSRVEKVLHAAADASPKDPAAALMQVSGQLLQAAANPQAAAAVFDNLSRRLGGEPGSKTDLDAVRADFGTKTPLIFTPADDPRTLAGIMSAKQTLPAPKAAVLPKRPAAASTGGTAAAALLAAFEPFRLDLPDGAEKQFANERQKQLGDIQRLAEAAELSFGGDPSTMGFDALIDRLIAREGRVAANLGLGKDVSDFSQIPARLTKIRQVNPQLATFMASVWIYRSFLNQAIASSQNSDTSKSQVALGTAFKPWEVYPDGKGSRGATLQGYTRDNISYVALAFDMGGGAAQFQGVNRDAHKALVIHIKGADISVAQIDFDGEGKPVRTTADEFSQGVLTSRESHDSVKGLHEISHYAGGKLVSTESLDAATGARHIHDLANGLDTTIGADKSVVIKSRPAPSGTPPAVTLRVGAIDAYGNFALQMLETQDGQRIVVKSPEVNELLAKTDGDYALVGWNVDVMGLVALKNPAERQTKAHSLAVQTIKAVFGTEDAQKVLELEGFLLDKVVVLSDAADGKDGPPVRLSVNKHSEFSLILAHSNGTKTILTGVFQKPAVYRDVVQGATTFGVLHAATMGTDGKLGLYDSSVMWQYLYDGTKVQWISSTEDLPAGWKFWKDDQSATHFFMVQSARNGAGSTGVEDSGWTAEPGAGWESKKDLLIKKTKDSLITRVAGSKPVEIVGGALNSVSMYAHAGWDAGLGAVTGSDAIKLEARTLWNNNPANRLFIKDPESSLLGGMPAAQKSILEETALQQRMKSLEANGVTESRRPIDVRLASEAPVSNNEMMGAAANFSAGAYLGSHGHPVAGFLVSASGQIVEIASGVAVTGGLASLGGKGILMAIGKTIPKALPTVMKVGGMAVKALDYGMMAAAGGMVVNDGVNLVKDWGDVGARTANLGKVTADMAFVGFFAAQRFKASDFEGFAPKDGPKLELTPGAPDVPTVDVGAVPKPTNLDTTIPASEPLPEIPRLMDPGTPPEDIMAPRDPLGPREPLTPPDPLAPKEPLTPHDPLAPKDSLTPHEPASPEGAPRGPTTPPRGDEMLRTLRADAKTLSESRVDNLSNAEPAPSGRVGAENPSGGEHSAGPEVARETGGAPRENLVARETLGETAAKEAGVGEKGSVEKGSGENVDPDKPATGRDAATPDEPAAKTGDEGGKPPEKSFLRRVNDWIADKEIHFKRYASMSTAAHPMPPPLYTPHDAIKNVVTVQPADPVKPVDGDNPGGNNAPVTDSHDQDAGDNDNTPGDQTVATPPVTTPKKIVPTPVASNTPSTARPGGGPGGGAAAAAAGGLPPSDKHPHVSMPGGGGGGGGGGDGGAGGGTGGGGGGPSVANAAPAGGASPAAGDISAVAPNGAHPASFLPPVSGGRSGVSPNSGGLNGGHAPEPSLAAQFDGSRERPRRGGTGTTDSMKGLGAGGDGGMPHFAPHGAPTTAPAAVADAALKDNAAASAAAPVVGPAAGGAAAKPEDEDYNYTYLSPARHKYELPTDRPQDARDWRYLMELGLQGSAALAAVYLFFHSDIGYLLGMTRRRKKADGESSSTQIL